MEERIWKVYMHTSPSNKRYIGITKRKVNKRWQNGNGYKHNTYFTNAIKKHGWNNFRHEILFENLSEKEAKDKEIELIKKYNSNNREYGYNITEGGEGTKGLSGELHPFYGKHLSEEHRKNLSISHKNLMKTIDDTSIFARYGKENPRSKPVYCFELNEYFDCVSHAVEKYSLNRDGIIDCCNHKQISSGRNQETNEKLHWIFTEDYINLSKQYDENKILSLHVGLVPKKKVTRKHSDETKTKMSENHADFSGSKNPSAKKVYCIELDEYFDTMKDAFLKYGINKNSICSCCTGTGNRLSAGRHPITKEKLHWRYA